MRRSKLLRKIDELRSGDNLWFLLFNGWILQRIDSIQQFD